MATTPKRAPGRPPSGPMGQAVSLYPQMTIRLPVKTKNMLLAYARLTATPAWKVVDSAIVDMVAALSADMRRDVERFAKRMPGGTAEAGEKG